MKITHMLALAILNVLALNVSVCPVFAKVPTTAKILFTSSRDGNQEVYIMNPDGSEQVNLTQHSSNDLQAVWSPTGEQILFVSNREKSIRDLYLMDPDGSNVQRVFKRKRIAYRYAPTWSPDGKQIAYIHYDLNGGKFTIRIATLGEHKEESVVEGWDPAWSPDGKEIAYIAYALDDRRITLIDMHTRKQKRLLPRKATPWQNSPSWSTAGDKLVFSWNKNPLPRLLPGDRLPPGWIDRETIYTVNRDGTDLQQLINESSPRARYPALSPKGDELLYTQVMNGYLHIFKLGVHSGTRTQLTHSRASAANFGGDWFDPVHSLPVSSQPELLSTVWGEMKETENSAKKRK